MDQKIQTVLANFNALARSYGASPAALIFQCPVRLMGTPAAFPTLLDLQASKLQRQARQEVVRGRSQKRSRRTLFQVGDSVRMKSQEKGGRYDVLATVSEVRDGGLS